VIVGVKTRLRLTVTNGGRGKATGARLEIDPPPGQLGGKEDVGEDPD